MTTRLDRLFLLLDTGSTPAIRKSAAEQLGEVQKLHPHELHNLLSKVHGYLGSTSWDTRIAAGQAVEAISKCVPPWTPEGRVKQESASPCPAGWGRLQLSQFDISRVLLHGASLLGSEGVEYDVEEENIGLDEKERLARQRALLNKRLGLDVAPGLGIQTEEWFQDDDLMVAQEMQQQHQQLQHQQSAQASVKEIIKHQLQRGFDMSARERNRAKRKAKLLARQTSRDPERKNGDGADDEPANKLRKTSSVVVEQPDQAKLLLDNVPDNTLNMEEMDEWPFEAFCELLTNDLFNPAWERRHGAATGLREVLKLHGGGAGKTPDMSADQLDQQNQLWLEDLALRVICVLALDRFGDFVSDEVVAPVRETCAQTLGVVLHHMSGERVQAVVRVLLQLLQQKQWEVRHGGLLGLKYLMAVRKDVTVQLLPVVLPAIFSGLQDLEDDVRAVAAAALLPVTDTLVELMPLQVPIILECLWHTLLDLDDLTASTNSIMTLLSSLLAHPKVSAESLTSASLTELVPRLWPFLRHNIMSVRRAALETLHTLLTRCQHQNIAAWVLPILSDATRHLYQRCLLENSQDQLDVVYKTWCGLLESTPVDHLACATCPWLGAWLCLMMQPSKLPFDPSLFIEAKHTPKEMTPSRVRHSSESRQQQQEQQTKDSKEYIGGFLSLNSLPAIRDMAVVRVRNTAARILGLLCWYLSQPIPNIPEGMETPLDSLGKILTFHLSSKSALQRLCVTMVVKEWAKLKKECVCPEVVKAKLTECLLESIYFDEIAVSFTRMQTECQNLIASLKQQGVPTDSIIPTGILTLEQAQTLCTTTYEAIRSKLKIKQQQLFDERRQQVLVTVSQTSYEQQVFSIRVQAHLAGALAALECLPVKMNPIIRPLMESLKKEENQDLQGISACSISQLVRLCVGRTPCPNNKVIKNLCNLLCSDPEFTPLVDLNAHTKQAAESASCESHCDTYSGILTLSMQQKVPECGKGRKASMPKKVLPMGAPVSMDLILNEEDEGKKQLLIQRRGATLALMRIATDFESSLPDQAAPLWDAMLAVFSTDLQCEKPADQDDEDKEASQQKEKAQELVSSLQVLEVVGPAIHPSLHPKLLVHLPQLCQCLQHPCSAVRHLASRCLGMLSKLLTADTMNYVLENLLPLLASSDNDVARQGAIEALANIIEQLGMQLVAYIVLLVVPVLGRMSDQDHSVRLMATQCFATLIKLMPLEAGIPDPPAMKSSLVQQKEKERCFLEQLLDGSKIDNHVVPVPIKAELRKYQQDGINWLAFLSKYKLHGILCDDMGLGKTLQSLCILAGDHYLRDKQHKETGAPDCAPLPSIVVCPPTLTGHWVYEVEKFVDAQYLNPLHYTGPPTERMRLQKKVPQHNLIVASYDVVRNDVEFFSSLKWNYCILDEGHIIKNSKTKLSKAVKQLSCNHRLILSGTPIQNNVLELWSLFDFLIPGFLGTEKQFQTRYGRPILQSRDAKSSTKEQEAGALAMEALHRQVLPFLLRRLKEDVLKDLPPKILQDYYCDLSPLQVQLYEDFAKSRAKKSVDDTVQMTEEKKPAVKGTTHIFQALQYLRKVCNHPALVLTPQHPEHDRITAHLKQQGTKLRDIQHAPKLTALRQLLTDCGIGLPGSDATDAPVVNQHRVLLFCQLKSMLDIVEKDLFKCHMTSVTYLRLDGSVPAGNRHAIVNRFNNDPSIDVLLLTTHVGGLGLNLTGADTVIFVEHDWNPMKDLQAMDRAHRIGQKKVVNVYRLVTRGTLEEKIMGLQKFKLNIANTIISQENSSLASMGTDQLLDLFSLEGSSPGAAASACHSNKGSASSQSGSLKNVLENMDELWDVKQYEDEYDLGSFMQGLGK